MSINHALLEKEIAYPLSTSAPDLSIIIVSFNTCELTRKCLESVCENTASLHCEILIVDNASSDGSAEMIESEFPQIRLLRSTTNLGFGNANNVALEQAKGRYFVLLNSDAFLTSGALQLALHRMDTNPRCGLAGGLLVGRDGALQPSARAFHTVLRDMVVLTGLAAKFPKSKFLGGFDRTWADPQEAAAVDWVPGAFSIVRPEALQDVGFFDPDFFLYYEEVDLCRRLKKAGYEVWYWPDIVITHIGGESSRQLSALEFSAQSSQVVLWRMLSTLLYYRKHHHAGVHLAYWLERVLCTATLLRNRFSKLPWRRERALHNRLLLQLLRRAWNDTKGGRISPPRPWSAA